MSTREDKGSSLPEVKHVPITEDAHSLAVLQQKTKFNLKELIRLNNVVPALQQAEKAKLLGCSKPHLKLIQDQLGIIQGQVEYFNKNRGDIYARGVERILAIHLTEASIKKATFKDAMWAAMCLIDKEHREREKSGGSATSLSALLKSVHVDMRGGTINIISPYKKDKPEPVDVTPSQESPKAGADKGDGGEAESIMVAEVKALAQEVAKDKDGQGG